MKMGGTGIQKELIRKERIPAFAGMIMTIGSFFNSPRRPLEKGNSGGFS
jgi:hypothetical protein